MNVMPQFKSDLIVGMDQRRAQAYAFVTQVSPTLKVHSNSMWTAKDLITHLAAFEEDMVMAIQAFMNNESYRLDFMGQTNIDDFNEARRQKYANVSWDDALQAWETARDKLRGVVIAFPEADLDTPFSTPFLQKNTLMQAIKGCGIHEKMHINEIREAHQAK